MENNLKMQLTLKFYFYKTNIFENTGHVLFLSFQGYNGWFNYTEILD